MMEIKDMVSKKNLIFSDSKCLGFIATIDGRWWIDVMSIICQS